MTSIEKVLYLKLDLRQNLSIEEVSRRKRRREVTSLKRRSGGKSKWSSSMKGEKVQRSRKRQARREVLNANLMGRKERICNFI